MIWRIRGRRAFARLERDGVRIRTSSLWCTFVLDPGAAPPRVAFAVGRAIGPAVTRNRVRRQLRAILQTMEVAPGWYLIGARPSVTELTYDQLRAELQRLMSRASGRA